MSPDLKTNTRTIILAQLKHAECLIYIKHTITRLTLTDVTNLKIKVASVLKGKQNQTSEFYFMP